MTVTGRRTFRASGVLTMLLAAGACAACGGGDESRARSTAREIISLAHQGYAEADALTQGDGWSSRPLAQRRALLAALRDTESRLLDADDALRVWDDDDVASAWPATAPCLSVALDRLATALRTAGVEASPSLDQAITMSSGVSARQCTTSGGEATSP